MKSIQYMLVFYFLCFEVNSSCVLKLIEVKEVE